MHRLFIALVRTPISATADWAPTCFVPKVCLAMLAFANDIRGAGITREAIEKQQLPLPLQDFLPETLEEQLICYADKFFSKTKLDQQKTVEQAEKSLAKFGEEGLVRFRAWVKRFGEPPLVITTT